MNINLWRSSEHAFDYLNRAGSIPHRAEGESALLEFIPPTVRRVLDLGTGDGRLLALVKLHHPEATAVAIDFSPAMLDAAQKRFAGDSSVAVMGTISTALCRSWAGLTRWFPASPFIILATHGSGRFTLRFTVCCVLAVSFATWNMSILLPQTFTTSSCVGSGARGRAKIRRTICSKWKSNWHGCVRSAWLMSTAAGSGGNWPCW